MDKSIEAMIRCMRINGNHIQDKSDVDFHFPFNFWIAGDHYLLRGSDLVPMFA